MNKLGFTSIAVCLLTSSGFGAVILSENFDTQTPTLNVSGAVGTTAFTTSQGNVDIIGAGNGFPLCVSPAGGNCVDLNGNTQGGIQTSVLLAPGNYTLSFALLGSQRGSTASGTVQLGSLVPLTSFNNVASNFAQLQSIDFSVATQTTATLAFNSTTPGAVGLIVDNIQIATPTAAVPEPASGLLLLAAGPFAYLLRKRNLG